MVFPVGRINRSDDIPTKADIGSELKEQYDLLYKFPYTIYIHIKAQLCSVLL